MKAINRLKRGRRLVKVEQPINNESTQYTLITSLIILGLFKLLLVLVELTNKYNTQGSSVFNDFGLYISILFFKLSIGLIIGTFIPILIYLLHYCFYLSDPNEHPYERVNNWYSYSIQVVILSLISALISGLTALLIKLFSKQGWENIRWIYLVTLALIYVIYFIFLRRYKLIKNHKVIIYQAIIISMSFYLAIYSSILTPEISIMLEKKVYSNSDDAILIQLKGDNYVDAVRIISKMRDRVYPVHTFVINGSTYIRVDFDSNYFLEDVYSIEVINNDKLYSNDFIYLFDERYDNKIEYIGRWKKQYENAIEKNNISDKKIDRFMLDFENLFSKSDSQVIDDKLGILYNYCIDNNIEPIRILTHQISNDPVIGVRVMVNNPDLFENKTTK